MYGLATECHVGANFGFSAAAATLGLGLVTGTDSLTVTGVEALRVLVLLEELGGLMASFNEDTNWVFPAGDLGLVGEDIFFSLRGVEDSLALELRALAPTDIMASLTEVTT